MAPTIEEVEDESEIMDVDNMDFDPSQFDPRAIINPAIINPAIINPAIINPAHIPSTSASRGNPQFAETKFIRQEDMDKKFKSFQILYPVYFDVTRSRAEGRRVGKEFAVENPLAREIVTVLNMNGFQTLFEPTKTHPQDWGNPGRVRVLLKLDGKPVHEKIKNKRQLYAFVGAYLQAHPTTPEMPMMLRFPNMPHPSKPPPPPAVPKGWKIGSILPLHSPALTGGGVSDNIFKEMMSEMGDGPGGSGVGSSGGGSGSGGGGGGGGGKEKKKKGKK